MVVVIEMKSMIKINGEWKPNPEYQHEHYLKNKEKYIQRANDWRENNLERDRKIKREAQRRNGIKYRLNNKMRVLTHYSGNPPKCVCCGFSDIRALQIDHIHGNGREHRRSIGIKNGGITFYLWLIKNNFPDGFQVLCANCNWIKRSKNKER